MSEALNFGRLCDNIRYVRGDPRCFVFGNLSRFIVFVSDTTNIFWHDLLLRVSAFASSTSVATQGWLCFPRETNGLTLRAAAAFAFLSRLRGFGARRVVNSTALVRFAHNSRLQPIEIRLCDNKIHIFENSSVSFQDIPAHQPGRLTCSWRPGE